MRKVVQPQRKLGQIDISKIEIDLMCRDEIPKGLWETRRVFQEIVGFTRPQWEQIKDKKDGMVQRTITDDTLPGGPRERVITYYAPFDKCDREKDYALAWERFSRHHSRLSP